MKYNVSSMPYSNRNISRWTKLNTKLIWNKTILLMLCLGRKYKTECIQTKICWTRYYKTFFCSDNVHYLFCSNLFYVRFILCIRKFVYLQTTTTITFSYFSEFGVNYVFQGFRQVKVQSLKLAWFMISNATPPFQSST